MPKMKLTNVTLGDVQIKASKKNTGGAFAMMRINATLTKAIREQLGIGSQEEGEAHWPETGLSGGDIIASLDAVNLILEAKQGNTLGDLSECNLTISLANGFKWSLEDKKDATSKKTIISFWVRTAETDSAVLMTQYKCSVSSGQSTGVMNYNKPGEGTAVDMSAVQAPGEGAQEEIEEVAATRGRRKKSE